MNLNINHHNKLLAFVSNNAWSMYNFRLEVLQALRNDGYHILIIAPFDQFTALLQKEGFTCINITLNNKSKNPLHDLLYYIRLKKIYRHYKPAYIFHYVIKPNIWGSLAAGKYHIPSISVVTGLGYTFSKNNWLSDLVKRLYRRAFSHNKQVWFLNKEDAAIFLNEKMVQPAQVQVLPGEGVNTAHFTRQSNYPPAEPFTFIMISRLLKSKGVELFAEATEILKKKYPIRSLLLGFFEPGHPDSINNSDLQRWVEKGILQYEGYQQNVKPFLEQAHCFVFPSYYNEGVPRCLMEAAAMRIPIVTTNNRGCREVVEDGVNGFLCEMRSLNDLVNAMEKMLHLPAEQLTVMGQKGEAAILDRFTTNNIISYYKNVIN